ncbi:MAG: SIR2 family protein [Candidatus Methylomirabilis sp.]|nr:SIR2 family protein [Deltaproteobacteria bacterium]
MTLETLTEDIAIEGLRNFFREKPFLFFGTGMSCSLDMRLGMPALKDALIAEIKTRPLPVAQAKEWKRVEIALQTGSDLESALNEISEQDLLKTITEVTGAFVATVDRECAFRIAKGEVKWPATQFLKKIVDSLPESDRILHALTPNYDMLFEYACDSARIAYTNGFFGGVEKNMDWHAVDRALLLRRYVNQRRKRKAVYKHRKHVRLYKVHGSLNYFFHRSAVIENNAWTWGPPDFAQRVMITPGLSKYEMLQCYRQELLKAADAAIDRENHFLFLGYGFNDKHLEEYIRRKLVTQSCKGLIITRDCNSRIESLLSDAANLWIVCKSQDASCEGTRVFNKKYSDWLNLPDKRLWEISEFTTHILGG